MYLGHGHNVFEHEFKLALMLRQCLERLLKQAYMVVSSDSR
jgi:hypothetical protein